MGCGGAAPTVRRLIAHLGRDPGRPRDDDPDDDVRRPKEAPVLDPQHYEAIAIDKRDGGVVLATLNRPDRLNAVNGTMHHELSRITREFDADPAAKVLVITGAGRAFC